MGRGANDNISQKTNDITISLTGFAGGYAQINTTKILKILSQISADIDEPITITSVRGNVDIFPNKVLFL